MGEVLLNMQIYKTWRKLKIQCIYNRRHAEKEFFKYTQLKKQQISHYVRRDSSDSPLVESVDIIVQ